jgi:hypothetical protein
MPANAAGWSPKAGSSTPGTAGRDTGSMDRQAAETVDIAGRLKRLYTAAVYDIMDEMGLRSQCLDLAIKPIERTMRLAGPAFTIAGAANPLSDEEYDYTEVKSSAACIPAAWSSSRRWARPAPAIGANSCRPRRRPAARPG